MTTQTTIKKFSGKKSISEIRLNCEKRGWRFNSMRYDTEMADWVFFEFCSGGHSFEVIFSPWDGRFITKRPDGVICSSSDNLDHIPWYSELLDFVYIPQN